MIRHPWEVSYPVATSAGMCAIWDPEYFAHVTDLSTWEDEVAEDAALVRHMEQGAFVPLNVGGGGTFQVIVRGGAGAAAVDERESRYVLAASEPYLLRSHGTLALGGLESVGQAPGQGSIGISVEPGRYSVAVYLIDWKEEPGALTAEGGPSDSALADFVVSLTEESSPARYRVNVNTFDRP